GAPRFLAQWCCLPTPRARKCPLFGQPETKPRYFCNRPEKTSAATGRSRLPSGHPRIGSAAIHKNKTSQPTAIEERRAAPEGPLQEGKPRGPRRFVIDRTPRPCV